MELSNFFRQQSFLLTCYAQKKSIRTCNFSYAKPHANIATGYLFEALLARAIYRGNSILALTPGKFDLAQARVAVSTRLLMPRLISVRHAYLNLSLHFVENSYRTAEEKCSKVSKPLIFQTIFFWYKNC
jgi:hypothetical protein